MSSSSKVGFTEFEIVCMAACMAALDLLAFKLHTVMLFRDLACLDIQGVGWSVLGGCPWAGGRLGGVGRSSVGGVCEDVHCAGVDGSGSVLLHCCW